MPNDHAESPKRVLEPIDRISEILFGLIMVLTFTGSLSVAQAGRDDVRTMLVGALGCNLAWGVIDGVFYLMGCFAERARNLKTFCAVRSARDPQDAQHLIAASLPPTVASVLQSKELEAIRLRLTELPTPPDRVHLRSEDWLGAIAVCLLVFVATFPALIPFIVMHDAGAALRVSNAIAIAMLFMMGYALGRSAGRRPVLVGVSMVVLGAVLVALTMALGG
jgi:hypothetical protein